jgi:tRNA threonylcarbamoyladenosine biosynthesis protein TsaB
VAGLKLLAIDTASSACSVALFADGVVVADRSVVMQRGHAEALVPMVAAVLDGARAHCPNGFPDIDAIAVTVGPGAFTGVRIGLAAAAAMAAAAGIPVIGLTTLEVVAAAQAPEGRPLLVALESKRSDVYAQIFDAGETPLSVPQAILPEAIAALLPAGPVALAGDGSAPVAAALRDAGHEFTLLAGLGRPEAPVLARLAALKFESGGAASETPAGIPPKPLYLRAPDATLPKRRQ